MSIMAGLFFCSLYYFPDPLGQFWTPNRRMSDEGPGKSMSISTYDWIILLNHHTLSRLCRVAQSRFQLTDLWFTCPIDIIDKAVNSWHFSMTLCSTARPHDAMPSPLWCICPNSSNRWSVQTTSRFCNSTTRRISWSVGRHPLTPFAPGYTWDTLERWVLVVLSSSVSTYQ